MTKRTSVIIITAAGLALCVAALLGLRQSMPTDDSLTRLTKAGSIRIGYAVEAPHAFIDPNGKVTGQSPEVARLVVARLGIPRIEWRLAEFSKLITELEQDRIDVIAAGMFITRQRAQHVAFSEPIFHVSQGMLVARGNPRRLFSYESLRANPKLRVAVLSGAVEQQLLRRIGLLETQFIEVPDALTGRVAVETDRADALALSSPSIVWMSSHEELGKTERAEPFTQPDASLTRHSGYGAFTFRREDKALAKAWNNAQHGALSGQDFKEIMSSYGFLPGDYPGDATTREILTK